MPGLDKAKSIIGRADPDHLPEHYFEIEATAVFEEGWLHIGEDHFYNERKRQIAGPSDGRTRILVSLVVSLETPATRDISAEWERQAGPEPFVAPGPDLESEQKSFGADMEKSSGGKCACDS